MDFNKKLLGNAGVLEALASALSHKYGLKVVFSALSGGCSDGKTIYLPPVIGDLDDASAIDLRGVLFHEIAHRFSNFTTIAEEFSTPDGNPDKKKAKLKLLLNFIEDPWVDIKQAADWPGCATWVGKCNAKVTMEFFSEDENGIMAIDKRSPFFVFCGSVLAHLVTEYAPKDLRDGVKGFLSNLETIDPKYIELLEKCKPTLEEFANHSFTQYPDDNGTQRNIDIAKAVIKVLEEELEEEKNNVDSGDEESAEGDEGESQGEGEGDEEGSSQSTKKPSGEMSRKEFLEELLSESDEDEGQSKSMFDEFIDEVTLRVKNDLSTHSNYSVLTTEGDVFKDAPMGSRKNVSAVLDKMASSVHRVRGKWSQVLTAVKNDRWEGGARKGKKLNNKKMYTFGLPVEYRSRRPFMNRVSRESLNTAMIMTIDSSGSMHGSKLYSAVELALQIGECVAPLNIPLEIWLHSTTDWDIGTKRYNSLPQDERKNYSRFGNLWIHRVKRFDESWDHAKLRLDPKLIKSRCNNFDGEVTRKASMELLTKYPDKRKILWELKDGAPMCSLRCASSDTYRVINEHGKYLVDQIAWATKAGVEVSALGVMTDEVKRYYPDYVVFDSMDNFVEICTDKLFKLLLKGKQKYARYFL